MIKANIETEVSPIVGTEKQSEELVHYLLEEFENDPQKLWDTNFFGKSLNVYVNYAEREIEKHANWIGRMDTAQLESYRKS